VKSYKEFFEKECFKKMDLTIERINGILKNDAEKFPSNTTNPYLTINTSAMDYPLMLNKKMMDSVYNDTLDQFYAVEETKNLGNMEEDSYVRTLNKMVEVMKQINAEKKIDATLNFFRIFSLYKWNGGKFDYDEIKREYMLRRKYFYCYEIIKIMPTNIIFQFIEDVCPDNYVCVDPNGIVIKSKGRDPRKVFKTDIEKNGINVFVESKNNKLFQRTTTNLRFKSLTNRNATTIKKKTEKEIKHEKESKMNNDVTNFDILLKMEENDENYNKHKNELIVYVKHDDDSRLNKFDQLYIQRRARLGKKKQVIINKAFNFIPLIGEVLAMANLDNLDKKVDSKFIKRETNLIKKYLLLYDANIPFVEKAASVLVNLVLCNTDSNKLKFILNEMLEGLCFGDDRSIQIFEEIVRTVIIDSLLKTNYYYFEELHAKVNLVKTLNKPFCYKSITKIRFLEAMLMLDFVKEKLTYIIWNNDTNKKIDIKIHETEISIPVKLPNNKRLFSKNPQYEFDNARDINIDYLNELKKIEKIEDDKKFKSSRGYQFKDIGDNNKSDDDSEEEDGDILKKVKSLRKQLNDDLNIKEESELYNELNKDEFSPNANPNANDDMMGEFKGFFNDIHFKQTIKEDKKIEKKAEIKEPIKETKENIKKSKNDKPNVDKPKEVNKKTVVELNSTRISKKINNSPKFKSITSDYSDENGINSSEFAKMSLNQYNNPHIYNRKEAPVSILTTERAPSQEEILQKVMKDPDTKRIIEEIKTNPTNKVLFPREIHTTYEVNRRGTKEITINKNNPTKNLIIGKLMDESTFNDMMDQQENNEPDDQTGLYKVLKNIQNKKCSCYFLCIEIGTIYGPFDNLRPKNVTIMTNHRENVQVIIKPVIVVNNTIERIPIPVPVPTPTPTPTPGPAPAPIIPIPVTSPNITGLFENDDCDFLSMSSLHKDTNIYQRNIRFKQVVDNHHKLSKMKRKFYRKVEYGNEILATEIFKQGLNVIILQREKLFKKVYERTFNTNVDAIESDAMACVIRDAGYDKVIVITGIGKWMGAITPRLIKEIKQIGGPDLNRLISSDGEDNSMVDHAFILIGRRGLCRYNGVFRVKNYDVSREMKKYFPDISSDPNDCYFENLTFENEKNKHSENQFFHLIDLRLTLNLINDNRFSYLAPIVKSVSPPFGPLNGGSCLNIHGENFGSSTLDIKEVLVRGVVCRDVILVNSNLITCTTGSSTIMGPGVGNVQVKLVCGLSSPSNTCNMYQYTKEISHASQNDNSDYNTSSTANGSLTMIKHSMAYPMIVHPMIAHPPIVAIHHGYMSPSPTPLFSFKEKNKNKYDDQGNPDNNDIINSLNNKLFAKPDSSTENVVKIDNLVTDNFNNLMSQIKSNGFSKSKDGFRKKRFQKIIQQLK
jgi:hypothetical protein